MKNLFLLFVLFLSTNLFSQITLNSSNNPTPGNTILNIDCDTAGIVQGNSGANQTWNFTSLTRLDSFSFNNVASSSTPYASQFPTSNIASTGDDTVYSYFTTSTANLISNGIGAPDLLLSYTDPQTLMQYPFTYNQNFTDSYSGTFSVGTITIYRTGTSTVTCDAWGTISLPVGTFSNAIRVKSVDVSKDSSNIGGFSNVSITNVTSYAWFVPNKKFEVFQIAYISVTLNGTPQFSTKGVGYSPNNPSIGITQLNTNVADNFELMQNYPNPFNPSTKIRFDIISNARSTMSNVKVIVYDELGKEITTLVNQNLSPGSYEVDWNAINVSGGVYYYKLITDNFTETKKMILLK